MSRHYFWAVRVPDEVKHEIEQRLNQVKSYFPFQRWVYFEDYHITLAFLGSAEQYQLHQCSESIEEAVIRNLKVFNLDIIGLDVFGKASMPTVFWAAVNVEEKLMELQQHVYEQCIKAKFDLETRPFKPHITLARKWSGKVPFAKQNLSSHNPFQEPLSFQVEEVILYVVNKDNRPKYEPITTITLKP